MASTLKRQIYKILETSDPRVPLSRLDDFIVTVLVILDVTAFVLETSEAIAADYDRLFRTIDWTAQIFFTIGYFLRMWSCTADRRYRSPLRGRIRYGLTPLAIVDLLAILPFYIIQIFPQLQFVAATRLFRLFRLLKISRYSESLRTLGGVMRLKSRELLMTLFSVLILLIFASSLMFFAETKAQPEAFPSIPAAMWWGVVTLTTVGYGDVYPVTPIGKLFGALLAFLGIGLFALPAGIIASGFSEEIERRKANAPTSQPVSKAAIATEVEEAADLMKVCLDAARQKFGDRIQDEAILRDLAKDLYREIRQKYK